MDTRLQKLILIALLVLGSFTAVQVVKAEDCITDGLTVCFDVNKNTYKIEAHASLKILVPNEDYGKAVVAYWDWYHPDYAGHVSYELTTETAGSQDVLFITQQQAGQLHNSLLPMNEALQKNVDLEKVLALNYDHLNFIPMTATGFAFLVNKTRLELLGLSLDDLNEDGLVDSVDSFEKIFELKPLWDSLEVNVLPMALNEPISFYPFLSAGGFRLFETYDALNPGFDSESFKRSLTFIQELSAINWNHSETNTSDTYTWKLDEVLVNDDFVFTIAGPWMNIAESDAQALSEWSVSKFPSYQEIELSPMVSTSGFAINKDTFYPSASHELIRILKSIKGVQLIIDHTELTPMVNKVSLPYLTFEDPHRRQMAIAYQSSVGEPVIAYPNHPECLAMELYYQMDLMSTLRQLWDKTLTLEEAQAKIVQEAQRVSDLLNQPEVIPND
jgi:hypothetical protein